jgi:hypothetical protein
VRRNSSPKQKFERAATTITVVDNVILIKMNKKSRPRRDRDETDKQEQDRGAETRSGKTRERNKIGVKGIGGV